MSARRLSAVLAFGLLAATLGFAQEPPKVNPEPAASPAADAAKAAVVAFESPIAGETVKGKITVRVSKNTPGGYVAFRIGPGAEAMSFARAVVSPYEMEWDTSVQGEGTYTIEAIPYDGKGPGEPASVTVSVQNKVEGAIPAGGVSLEVSYLGEKAFSDTVLGSASLRGLGSDETLPDPISALAGRLAATISYVVLTGTTKTSPALVRSSLRQGQLASPDGRTTDISDRAAYATMELQADGLVSPPSPGSLRIGLSEISLALPTGPVTDGQTWESPMYVVPDLTQRNAVYVTGQHKFDGLWWMRDQQTYRITSTYKLPDVSVGAGAITIQPIIPAGTPTTAPPTTAKPTAPPATGVGGTFDPYYTGGEDQTPGSPAGAPPTPGAPPPAPAPTQTQIAWFARLASVTGTRVTWIDPQLHRVVKTEDHLTGQVIFSSRGEVLPGATAAVTRFPINLRYELRLTYQLAR